MSRAPAQAEADVWLWLSQNKGWDEGIPNSESLAQLLFVCSQKYGGRGYNIRHAVREPEAWLTDLLNSPKKRKYHHKKAINIQLICRSEEQECFDTEAFNAAVAARYDRKRNYTMEQYHGNYRDILKTFLMRIPTEEIADRSGRKSRRIQQNINSNVQRRPILLKHFVGYLREPPPDIGRIRPMSGVDHGI